MAFDSRENPEGPARLKSRAILDSMTPSKQAPRIDFELLQAPPEQLALRHRRSLLWFLSLLGLLIMAVVGLVAYLQDYESKEAQRQLEADGIWLERVVRFHFRRLEEDMGDMARLSLGHTAPLKPSQAGQLWSHPGVIQAHGWLQAQLAPPPSLLGLMPQPGSDAAKQLQQMLDISKGLRRPAYAGPLDSRDQIWMAVPLVEQGQFLGHYVVVLSFKQAVISIIPDWFLSGHQLQFLHDHLGTMETPSSSTAVEVQLDMPGSDVNVVLHSTVTRPATVPRHFLTVALVFLLGMLISLYALRRDIVKRQAIEERLKAQIALRSAMENSVTTGLRAWDLCGKILYVNQAFCQLVGFSADELIGRSAPLPYWPAAQTSELHLIHNDIIEQGTQGSGIEVQFQHREGYLIDVLIHEAPLTHSTGEQLGWMSSVIDITERKREARRAAQQQQRLESSGRLVAMGEVASTLAHELNQPLGALSSFTQGLINRVQQNSITLEEAMPILERIHQLSDKAGRIIQRVHAFARRRDMHQERIELQQFLRQHLPTASSTPYVHIVLDLGEEPVTVNADAVLLEHALHNVVSNALHWALQNQQATSPQVHIRLEPHPSATQIALVIADNGPGVKENDRDQIFSAFFSQKEDGMGMGLAIVRSIVEAHHGHIEVLSDPRLGGACFKLWLPCSEDSLA